MLRVARHFTHQQVWTRINDLHKLLSLPSIKSHAASKRWTNALTVVYPDKAEREIEYQKIQKARVALRQDKYKSSDWKVRDNNGRTKRQHADRAKAKVKLARSTEGYVVESPSAFPAQSAASQRLTAPDSLEIPDAPTAPDPQPPAKRFKPYPSPDVGQSRPSFDPLPQYQANPTISLSAKKKADKRARTAVLHAEIFERIDEIKRLEEGSD